MKQSSASCETETDQGANQILTLKLSGKRRHQNAPSMVHSALKIIVLERPPVVIRSDAASTSLRRGPSFAVISMLILMMMASPCEHGD